MQDLGHRTGFRVTRRAGIAAGLLRHERQGRTRIYRIEKKRLTLVKDWLAWFSRAP